MTRLLSAIDRICSAAAAVAAVLLGILFLLGFAEIVLRSAFGISMPIAVEYSGYLLVLVLFLGSGWTLTNAGHIRVTLLSEVVSDKMVRMLDTLCTVIGLVVAGILTVALMDYAYGTWIRGTVSYYSSETPLAYPQALLAIGPAVLTLALVARLIRLLTGQAPEIKPDEHATDSAEPTP